jgi:hypothetical protein
MWKMPEQATSPQRELRACYQQLAGCSLKMSSSFLQETGKIITNREERRILPHESRSSLGFTN